MLTALATVLTMSFPFADGVYAGSARCADAAGTAFAYDSRLAIAGPTMTTTLTTEAGEDVFVKTAVAAGGGFFRWEGPEVESGEGYCTASGICHWEMTMRSGDQLLRGEDTMLERDGQLLIVGSVDVAGTRFQCEEVYTLVTGGAP